MNYIPKIWYFLDEASRLRLIEFIKTKTIKTTTTNELEKTRDFIQRLNIEDLKKTIDEIQTLIDKDKKITKEIMSYGESTSYDLALENGKSKILPFTKDFKVEHIKFFIDVILSNNGNQILPARGSNQIIETVFDETIDSFHYTSQYWQKLLRRLEARPNTCKDYEKLISKIKTKLKVQKSITSTI